MGGGNDSVFATMIGRNVPRRSSAAQQSSAVRGGESRRGREVTVLIHRTTFATVFSQHLLLRCNLCDEITYVYLQEWRGLGREEGGIRNHRTCCHWNVLDGLFIHCTEVTVYFHLTLNRATLCTPLTDYQYELNPNRDLLCRTAPGDI